MALVHHRREPALLYRLPLRPSWRLENGYKAGRGDDMPQVSAMSPSTVTSPLVPHGAPPNPRISNFGVARARSTDDIVVEQRFSQGDSIRRSLSCMNGESER